MYKRLFYATLATLAFTIVFSVFVVMNAYADRPITVYVDGKKVEFPDAQPQMIDGRIFVPIRFVAEALGATVERDAKTNSVYITSSRLQTNEPADEQELKQVKMGEVIEFKDSKIRVNRIEYKEGYFEGDIFAVINLDVYISTAPEGAVYWFGTSFVDSIITNDNKTYRERHASGKALIKLNEWINVDVMVQIPAEKEVLKVIVKNPVDGQKVEVAVNQ